MHKPPAIKQHTNGSKQQLPGTIPDKLRPHNGDAERAVIGSLLIDPDAIIKVSSLLDATDFWIERLGWIYDIVKSLFTRRQPADLVTICDELERQGQLKKSGGGAYLSELINACPTSINVEHYARIVERTATLRRIIQASGDISRMCYSDGIEEIDDIVNDAEGAMFAACSRMGNGDGPQHISGGTEKYLDRLEYLSRNQDKIIGIPTGLTDLDNLLGGLQNTDMIMLAGRPGMGKTSLALQVALNAAKNHAKQVAIFSLEMSDEQLIQRLVSAESGVDSQGLRRGHIKDGEWSAVLEATALIHGLPIYIDDTPAISALELRSKAVRLRAEQGLDLLVVDYLQLMRGDRKSGNREQEISHISRSIKALARELKIPVLALSQLSRSCEGRSNKRPIMSDLRDSGSLEQDADVVLFIYRDDMYNPDTEFVNLAEIIISKHRSGPTGIFSVYFKKHLTRFYDLAIRSVSFEQVENTAGSARPEMRREDDKNIN